MSGTRKKTYARDTSWDLAKLRAYWKVNFLMKAYAQRNDNVNWSGKSGRCGYFYLVLNSRFQSFLISFTCCHCGEVKMISKTLLFGFVSVTTKRHSFENDLVFSFLWAKDGQSKTEIFRLAYLLPNVTIVLLTFSQTSPLWLTESWTNRWRPSCHVRYISPNHSTSSHYRLFIPELRTELGQDSNLNQ